MTQPLTFTTTDVRSKCEFTVQSNTKCFNSICKWYSSACEVDASEQREITQALPRTKQDCLRLVWVYGQTIETEPCIHGCMDAPPLWNKLPPVLRQMSDPSYELTQTSPLAISPQLFHSKLKTLLFSKSYPDPSSSPYLPPRLNSKQHPP